jgi:hypothetical protein
MFRIESEEFNIVGGISNEEERWIGNTIGRRQLLLEVMIDSEG